MINVGICFGGKSVEHDISIITYTQVESAINKDKYNVIPLYLDRDNKRLQNLEDIIADNTKCLRLIMEAVITMLSHFEDGNHTKELSSEKKKLESYLLGYINVE